MENSGLEMHTECYDTMHDEAKLEQMDTDKLLQHRFAVQPKCLQNDCLQTVLRSLLGLKYHLRQSTASDMTPFTCFRTSEIDLSPAEEIIAAQGCTSFTFSGTREIWAFLGRFTAGRRNRLSNS